MLQKASEGRPNEVFWNALRTFVDPSTGITGAKNIWKPNWFNPSKDDSTSRLMFKALALSATLGGTAFLAKAVYNKRDELARRKKEGLVSEAVQASNPMLSPDSSLDDAEKEKKLEGIGVMKEAQFDRTLMGVAADKAVSAGKAGLSAAGEGMGKAIGAVPDLIGKTFNAGSNVLKSIAAPGSSSDPFTLVIPAVALLLAAGGSIYAADKFDMAKRKRDMGTRLSTARNEMDALNQAKLLIARGMVPPHLNRLLSRSNIKKEAQASTKNFLWAVLALTGAGAGTLGYMATKEFMDSRDPRRIKKKLMDAELQKMELAQGLGTPEVSLELDPETAAALDAHTGGPLSRKLIARPTTGSVNIEASPAGTPRQRDLLAL